MEKLELKHIAPYLPYGLKYQGYYGGVSTMRDIKHIRDYNEETDEYTPNIQVDGYTIEFIKPLLRPLSDLCKEIDDEVPADILFPKEFYSLIDFYEEHNRENQIQSFIKDGLNWCEPYSFWEYLFSKHFDVFGLIDKGLAIDLSFTQR